MAASPERYHRPASGRPPRPPRPPPTTRASRRPRPPFKEVTIDKASLEQNRVPSCLSLPTGDKSIERDTYADQVNNEVDSRHDYTFDARRLLDETSLSGQDRTPRVRPVTVGTRERTHSSGSNSSTEAVLGAEDVNRNLNDAASSIQQSLSYDAGNPKRSKRKKNSRRGHGHIGPVSVSMECISLPDSFDTPNLPLTREDRQQRSSSKHKKKTKENEQGGTTPDGTKRKKKDAMEIFKVAQSQSFVEDALMDTDQHAQPESSPSMERKSSNSSFPGVRRSLSAPNDACRPLSEVGMESIKQPSASQNEQRPALKSSSFACSRGADKQKPITVKSSVKLSSAIEDAKDPSEGVPSAEGLDRKPPNNTESRDADTEGDIESTCNREEVVEQTDSEDGSDRYQVFPEHYLVSEPSKEVYTAGDDADRGDLGTHAKASLVSIQDHYIGTDAAQDGIKSHAEASVSSTQDHSHSSSRASEITARAGNTQEHRRLRYSVPQDPATPDKYSDLLMFTFSAESKENEPLGEGNIAERSRQSKLSHGVESILDPEASQTEALQQKASAVECDASVEMKLVQGTCTTQHSAMNECSQAPQANRVGNFLVRVSSDISSLSGNLEGMHFLEDQTSFAASGGEMSDTSLQDNYDDFDVDAFNNASHDINMHCHPVSPTRAAANAATDVLMSGGASDWAIEAAKLQLRFEEENNIHGADAAAAEESFVYTEEVHRYRRTIESVFHNSAWTGRIEEFSSEALIDELEHRMSLLKVTRKEEEGNREGWLHGADDTYETLGEIHINNQDTHSVALSSLTSTRDEFSTSSSSRPGSVLPAIEEIKQDAGNGSDLNAKSVPLEQDPDLQLNSKTQPSFETPVISNRRDFPVVRVTGVGAGMGEKVVEGKAVEKDEDDKQFWVTIAVMAASTVIENGGNEVTAQHAADTVLSCSRESSEVNSKRLSAVASEVSVRILASGGSPHTAAAAAVAILEMTSSMPNKETSEKSSNIPDVPDASDAPHAPNAHDVPDASDAHTEQIKNKTHPRGAADSYYVVENKGIPTPSSDLIISGVDEEVEVFFPSPRSTCETVSSNEKEPETKLKTFAKNIFQPSVNPTKTSQPSPTAESKNKPRQVKTSERKVKTFAKSIFRPSVNRTKTSQTSPTAEAKNKARQVKTAGKGKSVPRKTKMLRNIFGSPAVESTREVKTQSKGKAVPKKTKKLRDFFGCAFICRKKVREKKVLVDPLAWYGDDMTEMAQKRRMREMYEV